MTEIPTREELDRQLWDDLLAVERDYQNSRSREVGPSDARALFKGGCERRLAYQVQGVEPTDEEPETLLRSAILGSAVHAWIAEVRKQRHPDWLVETQVQVPGFERPGAVDAFGDGTVDDVKTKSHRGFDMITELGKATEADQAQAMLYALGLTLDGHDVQRCSVTYVSRSNGDTLVDSWTYDHAEALALADRMHALIDRVQMLPPEAIARGGQSPEWRPCDGCPFRTECWQLDQVPEGYTALSYDLAPEEVAEAAEQLRLLRAEQAAVKEAIDFLQQQLQGHGDTTFTDSDGVVRRIAFSRAKPPGEGGALDSKAVRAHYAALGEEPPTLGVSPRLTLPKFNPKRK